ncbi:N-formylglutamate amidohydrolase [Natronocella acetinitrilica]|uniref:N-formylglutamate amidohydrolase n=1 Tax=Natronocella acetinitrilica TaxID=414046 RepID=A0AAE3G8Z8_9GAMM|nr:N-formylglutamate amidohydrolase [Natronocella acetinitrilica]MCP1677006.1 N-formylglutamate amidohydrolase [Natronocella acetinitrilica]
MSDKSFEIIGAGNPAIPVLAHIPHSSTHVPERYRRHLLVDGATLDREIIRLTDWHTDTLFSSLSELGAIRFVNRLSRIVMDPERFADDSREPMSRVGQGVVYTHTTEGQPLACISDAEREQRIRDLYVPYHHALNRTVAGFLKRFGEALIIDCHSFATDPLPSEPDQSRNRPDICIGTDPYHTPDALSEDLAAAFLRQGYSVEIDRPFSGTLIPTDYYRKDGHVQSIMIEVRRGLYCNEENGSVKSTFEATRESIRQTTREHLLAGEDFNTP